MLNICLFIKGQVILTGGECQKSGKNEKFSLWDFHSLASMPTKWRTYFPMPRSQRSHDFGMCIQR